MSSALGALLFKVAAGSITHKAAHRELHKEVARDPSSPALKAAISNLLLLPKGPHR